jgi:IPT/TIG domain
VAGEGGTVLAVLGRRDRRLSEALRGRVPGEVPPGPGGLLGLELEFSVRSARGGQVHFGSLIHRLALEGTALDPSDPNAYRCSWGGVITSDGAEAEIATPPVRTRPGFIAQLEGWARTGVAELRRATPRGLGLEGYSAHFSAAMPAGLNERVCRLYAETFAADLMLLMDRIDSPGLLVRPRPGRTELCGEFIQDQPLAAAAAFVAGTTRACAAAVRRHSDRAALPPRLDVRLARAVQRYGWYVDRRAFGPDLHAASRRALLPRASGGTIRAQSHLELAWTAARQALADDAAASDLQAADAMVTGALPLPAEQREPGDAPGAQRGWDARFAPDGAAVPDRPHLGAHVRPGFTLRPVAATWDFTVFEAIGPARRAYACIPRDSLPGFLAALEEGALDDAIAAYLALTSRRRVLSVPEQTRRPGLYDQMGAPAGLLTPERDPQTGRRESGEQGAKRTLARPGKQNRQDQKAPQEEQEAAHQAPRFFPRAAAIGTAAAVVLASAAAATALLMNAHSGPPGKPPGVVSLQPPALSFPAVPVHASVTRSITMTDNGNSPATITGMSIGGPSRHDFSVLAPGVLDAAYRGGSAVHSAAQPAPCHRSIPHAQTCTVTVTFTPSGPGSRTADLRIDLASPLQPQDIALSGTGTIAPPPSSASPSSSGPPLSSVSVTSVAPSSGPAGGGTSVVITGGGFAGATGVSFGGTAATNFTVDPAGAHITATSPPGSGTVDIIVTTPASTSAATTADRFTYTATTAPPAITSANATAFTAGTAGTFTVTTTGSPAPSITETGTLPSGVTFVDNGKGTATLSGTPATGTAGIYPITITAHNGAGADATQPFTLTVNASADTDLTISNPFPPPAAITVVAHGPKGAVVTYPLPTVSDPDDTTAPAPACSPASGAVFPVGTTTVTCSASDSDDTPSTVSVSFTVTVNEPPAITSANATTFTMGKTGTFTVTTTGSPTPSITEAGTLPSGVTFADNGDGTATLSGMPAAGPKPGTAYPITLTAHNGVGADATQNFVITVCPCLQ